VRENQVKTRNRNRSMCRSNGRRVDANRLREAEGVISPDNARMGKE